jgi:hypothetical protein
VNDDFVSTVLSNIRISLLEGGGLQDAAQISQVARTADVAVTGTWGDSSQPRFLATRAAVALDYGRQPGLGSGDALLLQFNQPVVQVRRRVQHVCSYMLHRD